jgi:hypothetical protein
MDIEKCLLLASVGPVLLFEPLISVTGPGGLQRTNVADVDVAQGSSDDRLMNSHSW